MEGAVDCGGGWGLAGPALECPQAATAVDFAPCGARSDTYARVCVCVCVCEG